MMRNVEDLYLTAALRLRGYRPVEVLGDGRRATWVFESTPELEEDVVAYYSGALTLPARDMSEMIRGTKSEAMNMHAPAGVR